MAETLEEWADRYVRPLRDRTMAWLLQYHFFRDPIRTARVDPYTFFSPADGTVLYLTESGDLNIKGAPFTLAEALGLKRYDRPATVVGIFLSFYDPHICRLPYTGRLSARDVDPGTSYNRPMIDVENQILDELKIPDDLEFLRFNERTVTTVDSLLPDGQPYRYHLIQSADYDYDCVVPFHGEHDSWRQGARFSQIRYGSQVDLVLPQPPDGWAFDFQQEKGLHLEAGVDAIAELVAA